MKPINFPQSNRLLGDNGYRSENVKEILGLPVWTNGEMCVSCWKMGFKERLSAFLFGKVFIAILSGSNQPPIAAEATRSYFAEAKANP